MRTEDRFKQASRGRPNQNTVSVKITKERYDIEYQLDSEAIAYVQKSVGMYPLLTNDRKLTAAQVLQAHKGQPRIEKRFEQVKTVHPIAPVYLKNPGPGMPMDTTIFIARSAVKTLTNCISLHECADSLAPRLVPEG